ncbi:MAG: hypothetical protein CBC03_01350 [Pseudoalteromonas sp. TMED43]|nr:MAG: hypothetical protein CBC03_01350 [Pseudoalteromonas sp. TMED43]|tara:strand:+ start:6157 stop:8076 length:1920 start_codon:yes stop_codon:yes gene_type:complete
MAFSVSPSVIVREVDASASVPAIATPPAAIAGVFRWGPVGEAVLVSSENELVSRFGTPDDNNYETFFVAADYLSYANALYVARADNGAASATASDTTNANTALHTFGAFDALYAGELGNSLEVAYVKDTGFSDNSVVVGGIPATRISGNTVQQATSQTIAFNSSNTTFEVLPADEITTITAGDVITVGNDSVGYQDITVSTITKQSRDSDGLETANTVLTTAIFHDITFDGKYLLPESDLNKLSITRKWAYASTFVKAPSSGNYHIVVVDEDGVVSGEAGSVLEVYSDVSTTSTARLASGKTNYYKDVILQESSWVKVANTTHFEAQTGAYESLSLGTDGRTETTATLADLASGYDLFKAANEIDVSFILGGKSDDAANVGTYIISNITEYRKDCMAFISPAKSDVVDESKTEKKLANILAFKNALPSSSYSVIDSGYKYRYDRYNDVYRYTPLNGDIAGLASRVEPFESPAGFRKGVIKNVVKLAFNPNKAQRDQLYSGEVNPVMAQSGRGIVLFGDKTGLGGNSAFDNINVRRLFIAVEKAIANAAESFLFELNDEFTQAQFKGIVEPFLRDIQGKRGIVDFRVVSDTTVNTPSVIDSGKFRANIFIKPARSINVIELTFVATRSGVEFDEIVGSLT